MHARCVRGVCSSGLPLSPFNDSMNRYTVCEGGLLGDGSFGRVFKAVDSRTGEVVAIKTLKAVLASWSDCVRMRETATLSRIRHENIIRLREVIYEKEAGALYYVFDAADANLYSLMTARARSRRNAHCPGGFTEPEVAHILACLLRGLAHCHRHGVFHRDVKPENVLCDAVPSGSPLEDATDATLMRFRLCDFGQARETRSVPPYTPYCGTRWYRAPEVLLDARAYNSPIDVWAAGALAAELLGGRPLAAAPSSHAQLYALLGVLGVPTPAAWPEGYRAAAAAGVKLPPPAPSRLGEALPSASPAALEAVAAMCSVDAAKRPTALEVLSLPFFAGVPSSSRLSSSGGSGEEGSSAAAAAGRVRDSGDTTAWSEDDFNAAATRRASSATPTAAAAVGSGAAGLALGDSIDRDLADLGLDSKLSSPARTSPVHDSKLEERFRPSAAVVRRSDGEAAAGQQSRLASDADMDALLAELEQHIGGSPGWKT